MERKQVVLVTVWGVRIVLALAFAAAGAAKLASMPQMVVTFEAIGFGQWFQYFTGVVELLGVVLLLVPRRGFIGGLWLGGTMVVAGATQTIFLIFLWRCLPVQSVAPVAPSRRNRPPMASPAPS